MYKISQISWIDSLYNKNVPYHANYGHSTSHFPGLSHVTRPLSKKALPWSWRDIHGFLPSLWDFCLCASSRVHEDVWNGTHLVSYPYNLYTTYIYLITCEFIQEKISACHPLQKKHLLRLKKICIFCLAARLHQKCEAPQASRKVLCPVAFPLSQSWMDWNRCRFVGTNPCDYMERYVGVHGCFPRIYTVYI